MRWTLPRLTMSSMLLVFAGLWALVSAGMAETVQNLTPLLLTVQDAPIPFNGSDGRVHLVYELWITNFSSGDVTVEKVEVLGDGAVLQTLGSAAVAGRLQAAGSRESSGTMAKSTQALLFLHVVLEKGAAVPQTLSHRVAAHVSAAPPGFQEVTETSAKTKVDRQEVVRIGPPLEGAGYISADSCCDATRHTRAALPVNGRVWVAQRYAVDWEQMDANGRIYEGPQQDPKSYTIFGKPVLAVADATVVGLTDGLPEQTPGKFPSIISLDEADGNSVILDLGEHDLGVHRYAMYAHMQPGSIKVRLHDRVKRGQLIGLVGNSGNSVAPHLHFQVMDGVFSLASNGLPYEIEEFQVTGKTPGTEPFDDAESKGIAVPITAISPAEHVSGALPLDQLVISFGGQ
jgi:Peptidase family M23